MSSRHVYTSIIVASVLGLSLFILFGPGGEKKSKEAYLWEQAWAKIEFQPAKESLADKDGKKAADAKKKPAAKTNSKKKKTKTPPADPHVGKIPMTFLRTGGLFKDKFQIISPTAGKPGAPMVRRVGNNSVKGIFQTWHRPKFKSVYTQEQLAKQKTTLTDLGISGGSARIKLYESETSEPVIITVGKKLENGDIFLQSSLEKHKGLVFGVAAYNVAKMKSSFISYRDRRFVVFPSKTYTGTIELTYGKPGKDGKRKSVIVEQFMEKNKKGKEIKKWRDVRSGLEIPTNVASRLNSFSKQLTIRFFSDEAKVASLGNINEMWKAAKDEFVLRVKVKGGGEHIMTLRKPAKTIKADKVELFLIRDSRGFGPDYAEMRIYKGLETRVGAINASVKAAEKRKARAGIPARPTPLMQPKKKPRFKRAKPGSLPGAPARNKKSGK